MKKSKRCVKMLAMGLAVCMAASSALPAKMTTVKAEDVKEDTSWNAIQDVVSRYYGEWSEPTYPGLLSNQMPDTALLGNGDVGVTSGGNNSEKTFYVSKGDFWSYGTSANLAESGQMPIGGITIKEAGTEDGETEQNGENIALTYKNVTASTHHDAFTPDKAVDGKMQQTPAGYGWCSSVGNPQWLQLEFEEPVTIGRYIVKSDGAVRPDIPGIEANNTSDFKLQISDTGEEESWTDVDSVTGNILNVFDKDLETPATAKFVRIYVTKGTQETTDDTRNNPRARIGQFELYAEAKNVNLAPTHQTVTASSTHDNFTPINAVDGKMENGIGWCTSVGKTQWLQLEFEEPVNIARYVVKGDEWARPGLPDIEANNPSDFNVQVSDTGEEGSWTDADVVVGNQLSVVDRNLQMPVTAKYVRLYITKPTQETTADSQNNPRARIAQFELYAYPGTAVDVPEEPVEQDFYERQDILNAEIQTKQVLTHTPTEMTTWLSSDKNFMVTEVLSKSAEPAELQVEIWAANNEKAKKPITAENDQNSVTVTRATENRHKNDNRSWTSKAALATKMIGADDVKADSDNDLGKGTLRFTLEPDQKVYVVTAIGGGGRTYTNTNALWEGAKEPVSDAQDLLSEVMDESGIIALNAQRQNWWKNYWSASYVDFGTEDEKLNQVQKYYYGAQYILGSTAKAGKLAPGLYGVWRTNDTPGWHGDYHMNYNFMSSFYGAASSNRSDLLLPAAETLFNYMEEGERRAASLQELKKITGNYDPTFVDQKIAKGDIDPEKGVENALLIPLGIGPWGSTTDDVYLNEALGASYNSYLITQYFDYTLDEEILEQAYDYLKKCAAFYEAWLEKEDGRYNLYAGWCETMWGKNPAIELAAVQNVFRNLLSMSEQLGVDEDKRELWNEIYEDMSIKPTWVSGGKTVYGLAEKRLDPDGGKDGTDMGLWGQLYSNVVMLDYFLPGGGLGYFSTPEELQTARDTLDLFDSNSVQNTAWNNANNFPRVYPDAVKARYDVGQVIDHFYNNISGGKMAANLRIVDGQHGVEKCGATEAINSMMLASDKGITKIFPNWYADKDAKFANLRAKGAFTISAQYDGAAQEANNVVITSEKGETMKLVSPWAEGATVRDSAGNVVETEAGTVPGWEEEKTITFATTAGETYTVEKGEAPVELDYEAIDKVIAEAEAIKQDGYTPESYQALQDALNSAKEARLNATNQDELNQKEDGLRAAIDGLKGSKNVLETFLNRAKQHVENGDIDGLVESVQKLFAEAIAEGEAIMANENATKDDVLKASLKLMKAIQALDMKAGDKADLGMALELTAVIDLTQYVEAGQAEYLAAKAEAERVMEYGDAMQPEVNTAWETLVDTMMNLRLKADKAALSDLLDSVKDLDLSKYTDESVKVFTGALTKANGVMEDETLSIDSQAEVDRAVKLLADARDGLTEKKGSGGKDDNSQNGGGQNGNGQNGNGQNGNSTKNNGSANQGIKTGDAVKVFVPIIGLVLSFGAAAAGVFFRRKRS